MDEEQKAGSTMDDETDHHEEPARLPPPPAAIPGYHLVDNRKPNEVGCSGFAMGFFGGIVINILCLCGAGAVLQLGRSGRIAFFGALALLQLLFVIKYFRSGHTAIAAGIITQFALILLAFGGCMISTDVWW